MEGENIIIDHCRKVLDVSENEAYLNYKRNIEN